MSDNLWNKGDFSANENENDFSNETVRQRNYNAISRSDTQQRNDDLQSYNQNNSFRAGERRMNMDDGTSMRLSGSSEAIEKTELIEDLLSSISNLSTQNNWGRKSFSTDIELHNDDDPYGWPGLLKKSEDARLVKLTSLPPIIKNFYQEDPSIAGMRPEDVEKFRSENNAISVIKIYQDDVRNIPNPVSSFKQAFNYYPELLKEIKKQGFSSPTPIQCQAWPIILQGYDMIGISQTGTGKTIAFLFPAFVHIVWQIALREERIGPSVLIIVPTAELAQQIESEAKKYQYGEIKSICIYGGVNRKNQINNVIKGIDIVIATPGRLIDLCMSGIVDLSGVTYLVLDEADRLLDMGFEPQIRKIIIGIREDRQTVMTSATCTEAIQEFAIRYMKSPFKVKVGAYDLAAVHSVTQEIIFGEDNDDERRELLDEFIKSLGSDEKVIIYVEETNTARNIANDLNIRGTKVQSIHGKKKQLQRENALNDFKTGIVKILIATGGSSRGIDIKDVPLIFNLYFPSNIEEYVHRIGRTGRAGKAISVVTRKDSNHAANLINILEEANQYVPNELYDMAHTYKHRKVKKMAVDRAVLKNDSGSADTSIRLSGAIEKTKLVEDLVPTMKHLSIENNLRSKSSRTNTEPLNDVEDIGLAELLEKSEKARLKKITSLPPIIKNFYQEDPAVACMRPEDVKKFRSENNSISVKKINKNDVRKIPNPVSSFKEAFNNYPELLEELKKQGFSSPSPIQCQAWPILLQGYDMIGIAQTGTGKTIAFLFPALVHIVGQNTEREKRIGPSALILAPTRELAQQIETEAKKYPYKGIKSICIYGGVNRNNQINNLTKGIDIVIATPGRLNDLCMTRNIDLSGVTYLVLDEADRMLDMGFEPQIRKIIIGIREDRKTVMTSATWTGGIQEIAYHYMKSPFKVKVGAFDLAAAHSVTQEFIFGEDDDDKRRALLDEFIKSMGPDDKAIVFVERKKIARNIANDLNIRGTKVQSIHGNRAQHEREQALNDFKTGIVKILIATGVASRGIDIKDITLIFNLYFPRNIEEYVHRVGRTGRAGRSGKAISVVTRKDSNHAADLINILEEANQYVPNELYDMAPMYRDRKVKKRDEDRDAGGKRPGRGGRTR